MIQCGCMATIKKRINISVSKEEDMAIAVLAERDSVPQATKAAHLLRVALELEEDALLVDMVRVRDTKNTRFVSHKKAWGV